MTIWRIGTRGSALALWQARAVADQLARSGHTSALTTIKTSGDTLQDSPLAASGTKHRFVKEIEDALLSDRIDLAVHSTKDLPIDLPDGLIIAGYLQRADPHDVVVLSHGTQPRPVNLNELTARLGEAPVIGTSSIRRTGQLAHLWPHARFAPIRGNVDTRLSKLDRGDYTALVLAAAGLERLGLAARVSFTLPLEACVPAPGQGAVAMEIRAHDATLASIVAGFGDEATAAAVTAERAVVASLGGGCETPIGALAVLHGTDIEIHVVVASPDGRDVLRRHTRGPRADAVVIAQRLAAELVAAGAARILRT